MRYILAMRRMYVYVTVVIVFQDAGTQRLLEPYASVNVSRPRKPGRR